MLLTKEFWRKSMILSIILILILKFFHLKTTSRFGKCSWLDHKELLTISVYSNYMLKFLKTTPSNLPKSSSWLNATIAISVNKAQSVLTSSKINGVLLWQFKNHWWVSIIWCQIQIQLIHSTVLWLLKWTMNQNSINKMSRSIQSCMLTLISTHS